VGKKKGSYVVINELKTEGKKRLRKNRKKMEG
jgi:hypothetical protein